MQTRGELGKLAAALEGIPVWGCLPGSAAEAAGVRYGDVVIEVNGRRTRDIDDYLAARDLRNDGVEMLIFRDGRERRVEMRFRRSQEAPDRLVERIAEHMVEQRLLPIPEFSKKPSDPAN